MSKRESMSMGRTWALILGIGAAIVITSVMIAWAIHLASSPVHKAVVLKPAGPHVSWASLKHKADSYTLAHPEDGHIVQGFMSCIGSAFPLADDLPAAEVAKVERDCTIQAIQNAESGQATHVRDVAQTLFHLMP